MWISQQNVNSGRAESDPVTSSPRPQASHHSLKHPKAHRLLERADFKEIGQTGTRYYGNVLVIVYRPSVVPKLGITASRSFGKAHIRNHFKRLVREAFRTQYSLLPPYELVILPQRGLQHYTLPLIIEDLLKWVDTV